MKVCGTEEVLKCIAHNMKEKELLLSTGKVIQGHFICQTLPKFLALFPRHPVTGRGCIRRVAVIFGWVCAVLMCPCW